VRSGRRGAVPRRAGAQGLRVDPEQSRSVPSTAAWCTWPRPPKPPAGECGRSPGGAWPTRLRWRITG